MPNLFIFIFLKSLLEREVETWRQWENGESKHFLSMSHKGTEVCKELSYLENFHILKTQEVCIEQSN